MTLTSTSDDLVSKIVGLVSSSPNQRHMVHLAPLQMILTDEPTYGRTDLGTYGPTDVMTYGRTDIFPTNVIRLFSERDNLIKGICFDETAILTSV